MRYIACVRVCVSDIRCRGRYTYTVLCRTSGISLISALLQFGEANRRRSGWLAYLRREPEAYKRPVSYPLLKTQVGLSVPVRHINYKYAAKSVTDFSHINWNHTNCEIQTRKLKNAKNKQFALWNGNRNQPLVISNRNCQKVDYVFIPLHAAEKILLTTSALLQLTVPVQSTTRLDRL